MEQVKITVKLVVSIVIISLFSLFLLEMGFSHITYDCYIETLDKYEKLENRTNEIINLNLKLINYIEIEK